MVGQSTQKGGMFDWYFGTNLLMRIMAGLILGVIVGIFMAYNQGMASGFFNNVQNLGAQGVNAPLFGRNGCNIINFFDIEPCFA